MFRVSMTSLVPAHSYFTQLLLQMGPPGILLNVSPNGDSKFTALAPFALELALLDNRPRRNMS